MRKFFATATFLVVGVLSLFGMSRVASATVITQSGTEIVFDYGSSPSNLYRDLQFYPAHTLYSYWTVGSHGSTQIQTQTFADGNYQYRECYPEGDPNPLSVNDDSSCTSIYTFTITSYSISNIVCISGLCLPSATLTRFISFDPGMGNRYSTTTPTASSSVTFYLNNDVVDSEELRMRYSLYRQGRDGIRRLIDGGNDITWDFFNGTGQYGESTVYFPNQFDYSIEGVYYWSVDMCRPSFWSWSGCKSEVASSTYFIVGDVVGYEQAQGEAGQEAFDSYASTTLALARSCNPLADFSFSTCLKLMIVPSPSILVGRVTDVLAIPPWGYVYRLYEIFALDSASSSLPVISATIPNGVVGAGSSISLDANHVLDFVLYASTSQFLNSSASSTETFFEYTNRYWSVLVYLGFGFYVLSRIIGLRRVNIK